MTYSITRTAPQRYDENLECVSHIPSLKFLLQIETTKNLIINIFNRA